MRSLQRRSPGSRRLTLLFAAVLLPPAIALVWLGATLLDRDRAMLAERGLERREATTEIITRALLQSVNEAERWLVEDDIPDGAVRATRSSGGFSLLPAGRVLWTPELPVGREAADAPFAEGERVEFDGTGDRGLARYESLARSPDAAVRAGAFIRLARVHRRAGNNDRALVAYRNLATLGDVTIHHTPVDLVARRMICEILDVADRNDELAREAGALRQDLVGGRWLLDRAAWELAAADVAKWTGHRPVGGDRQALSGAVDWVDAQKHQLPASGRTAVMVDGTPVTIAWQTRGSEFRAVVVTASVVDRWRRAALERDLPASVTLGLVTASGQIVAGTKAGAGVRVISRAPSETGLPWTLVVGPGVTAIADAELVARRRLLGAGVAALVLLLAGGTYLLWRVVQRELAVARLQTDFVAAVSHEFRTPLTSLRHITDLLQEDDDLPAGRRESLYSVLGQSTDRLHRLVESLLDFARMEGGRKPWTLRPVDLPRLVAEVVASFRSEHAGVAINLAIPAGVPASVEADTDALTHALWNLLDNAVKYSPAGATDIDLSVRQDSGGVAIAVSDRGLGIPSDELKEIFQKFVRGRRASELGIPGTGLGLAMVSHIVTAHGGRIDVESQEGQGSTFTIVLPGAPARSDVEAVAPVRALNGRHS